MRFFPVLDFQQWVLALCLGLALVISIYVVWGTYTHARDAKTKEELDQYLGHEVGPDPGTAERPVAPFLIFLIVGVVVWAISYFIYIGLEGGPIG